MKVNLHSLGKQVKKFLLLLDYYRGLYISIFRAFFFLQTRYFLGGRVKCTPIAARAVFHETFCAPRRAGAVPSLCCHAAVTPKTSRARQLYVTRAEHVCSSSTVIVLPPVTIFLKWPPPTRGVGTIPAQCRQRGQARPAGKMPTRMLARTHIICSIISISSTPRDEDRCSFISESCFIVTKYARLIISGY